MAAAKWIKKFYAEQRGVELVTVDRSVEAYTNLLLAATEYRRASELVKKAEKSKANAAAILQEYIKDGAGIESEEFKVTWKQDKKGRVDWKKVAEYFEPNDHIIEQNRMQPPRKFLVKLKESGDE